MWYILFTTQLKTLKALKKKCENYIKDQNVIHNFSTENIQKILKYKHKSTSIKLIITFSKNINTIEIKLYKKRC